MGHHRHGGEKWHAQDLLAGDSEEELLSLVFYAYTKDAKPMNGSIKETIGRLEQRKASIDKAIGIARSNSLWPLPFATSCCGIEFMATMSPHYDLARFGAERLSFSPRQADLLMVMGTISKKMGPVLRQVYLQMAEPRWVIAIGACASSGGIFDSYPVLQGID